MCTGACFRFSFAENQKYVCPAVMILPSVFTCEELTGNLYNDCLFKQPLPRVSVPESHLQPETLQPRAHDVWFLSVSWLWIFSLLVPGPEFACHFPLPPTFF